MNDQKELQKELATTYLRTIEMAFVYAFENGGRVPTFGRARSDVHELISLVGYPGSGSDAAVEVNGIPIVLDDTVLSGCVELGFGPDTSSTELMCVVDDTAYNGLRHGIHQRNAGDSWRRSNLVLLLDGIDRESCDLQGFIRVAWHLKGAIPLNTWLGLSAQERKTIRHMLSVEIDQHR